ncbi:MAG: dephospho-CoA kinase [Legionella sp.]|nr:dephospho-CoA kinase [Legionella sp.]
MYVVGLTGNIGTGKSTVANMFKEHGAAVLSADTIAREVTRPSEPAWQEIINHFGNEIVCASGEINRSALREIIFQRPTERTWLEALLHPLIRSRILEVLALQSVNQKITYSVVEIPLLLKREDYPYLNRVLLIVAPEQQKISRLMKRDGHSEAEALAILATQPKETLQRTFADDILNNDGDHIELGKQVSLLHIKYLEDAQSQ